MSQILLIHICLWPTSNILRQFPHNLTEQRDEDYITQTKNMCVFVIDNLCGEILCIIYAEMIYGNVV